MTTVWQQSESFANTNLQMLDNGYLCDVILVAGNDQKQLQCHKFILASRSPVFHAMFCGTLTDSNDVVNIPDIEESVLRILIRYLYSNEIDLSADIVMSLMYAANKYDVSGLETICELFLKESIDTENVCIILEQALRFDYQDLKHQCLDIIKYKSKCVLESDAFVEMSMDGLKEVLEMNRMLSSECEVYLACKRWASKRIESTGKLATGENIRNEFGDEIINLIRFPSMTSEEFTDVVSNDDVLTQDETISIYQTIAKNTNISKFKNEPRGMTRQPYMFVRAVDVHASNTLFDFFGNQNGLTFTVSNECALTGVDMFLPVSEGSAAGDFEILEGTRIIHSQNVQLCYNDGLQHTLVSLERPIYLISQQEYSIRHNIMGARQYRCISSLSQISIQNVTLTLLKSKVEKSDPGKTLNCGQFYGFELSINIFD